ncbi:MAG: hypothetical protein MI673_04720, partial [Thiotrichales bacterium]|nr:hypothetical protein [Thiotrichales bacterium]
KTHHKVVPAACVSLLLVFWTSGASAMFTRGSSAGDVGMSATNSLDFDELGLPAQSVVTNQYPGVTFSPNLFQRTGCGGSANLGGGCLDNFGPNFNNTKNPINITFSEEVNEAGFHMVTNLTHETRISAYLGNQLIEDSGLITSSNTDFTTNFFAFIFNDMTFDRIRIEVGNEIFTDAALIDNLAWSVVPIPRAGFLFLTGIIAFTLLPKRSVRTTT